MAVSLVLSGSTGSTTLILGADLASPVGVLTLVGPVVGITEVELGILSPVGILSLSGVGITPSQDWSGNAKVGVLSFASVSVPGVETDWTGLAPAGILSLLATAADAYHYVVPSEVGSSVGVLSFTGGLQEVDEDTTFIPLHIFPGYVFTGTDIVIPISELPGISVEEADAVTGDWRKLIQATLLACKTYYDSVYYDQRPFTFDIWTFENYNARSRTLGDGMKRNARVSFNVTHAAPQLTDKV